MDAWLQDDIKRRRNPLVSPSESIRERNASIFLRILLVGFVLSVFVTSLVVLVGNAHAETVVVAVQPPPRAEKIIDAVITAYTSSVDETDDTPFETASGATTSAGVLACPPEYKFGTQVKIGEATYTCRDRMNERYWKVQHFDVWVHTKAEAREWGSVQRKITIYEK